MTAYQVMIEGVFVSVPALVDSGYGFHSTFYLEANNAPNAIHRVKSMMQERLQTHGVRKIGSGPFKTYYWVRDIWEISSDKFKENAGKDFGFSFFRIGRLEKFYLYVRHLFFQKFKPWILVSMP